MKLFPTKGLATAQSRIQAQFLQSYRKLSPFGDSQMCHDLWLDVKSRDLNTLCTLMEGCPRLASGCLRQYEIGASELEGCLQLLNLRKEI